MFEHITHYRHFETDVGRLLLAGDDRDLMLISFPSGSKAVAARPGWTRDESLYPQARAQLAEYFAGKRTRFAFPMRMVGTAFQKSVWNALLTIPFGATTTYGTLARQIGRPSASRAVGAANGANPLSIVVPCHRVIGSTGSLTGFGGGIETKRYLLALESKVGA